MKKIIAAAFLMVWLALPAYAASTVQITFSGISTETTYDSNPFDPPVVSGPYSYTAELTGSWESGFNSPGPIYCSDCMMSEFVGNDLIFTNNGTMPCYCDVSYKFTFDRDVSGGPSALYGANFVSGSYYFSDFTPDAEGAGTSLVGSINSFDVPEPASWLMMLGGLFLMGFVLRRQRTRFSCARA